jgi:hypothetical protein
MFEDRYLETEGSGEGLKQEDVSYAWRRKMLNTYYYIVRKLESGGEIFT